MEKLHSKPSRIPVATILSKVAIGLRSGEGPSSQKGALTPWSCRFRITSSSTSVPEGPTGERALSDSVPADLDPFDAFD